MSDEKNIDILLKEYEELTSEIRNIHDKRITLFKIFISAFVGLLGFIFAGVIIYIRSGGAGGYSIPLTVAYCYSSLGILFSISVYSIIFGMYCHLGSSKKHTVRYWKAIHAIRLGLKNLRPDVSPYLVMPDAERNAFRPNISKKWTMTIFAYLLFNLMFAVLIGFLLIPFFSGTGNVLDKIDMSALKKAATLIWPFLMLFLAGGAGEMKRFWENIQLSRLMTPQSGLFPSPEIIYIHNDRKKRQSEGARWMLRGIHIILVSLSFIACLEVLFLNKSTIEWLDVNWKGWPVLMGSSLVLNLVILWCYLSTYFRLRKKMLCKLHFEKGI